MYDDTLAVLAMPEGPVADMTPRAMAASVHSSRVVMGFSQLPLRTSAGSAAAVAEEETE